MTMPRKEYGTLEKDIAEAFVAAIVSPSLTIDTFSTWLLGGTAAAVALVISNADKLVPRVGTVPSKLLLIALGISVIFGLLQKFFAVQLQYAQQLANAADSKLHALVTRHAGEPVVDPFAYIREKANVVDTLVLLISAFPKSLQKQAIGKFLHTSNDPAEGNRAQVTMLVKQFMYLSLQIVFVMAAIPIAAYGI